MPPPDGGGGGGGVTRSHAVTMCSIAPCVPPRDCGLACVLMILQATGKHACDHQLLRQLCPTTSIWTVDLAHLLRHFGLQVAFLTVTLGPNPAYANETFYMEHMMEDERRVSQLFVDAGKVGITIQQRSVGTQELQELLLSGEHLVVALIDKRKFDPWLMAADSCLPCLYGMNAGYSGHYILLVGFDSGTSEYLVRDPAALHPSLWMSATVVDQARRSFGTDEDLLIVSLGWAAGPPAATAARGDIQGRTAAGHALLVGPAAGPAWQAPDRGT